jgi:hypothetical protein
MVLRGHLIHIGSFIRSEKTERPSVRAVPYTVALDHNCASAVRAQLVENDPEPTSFAGPLEELLFIRFL